MNTVVSWTLIAVTLFSQPDAKPPALFVTPVWETLGIYDTEEQCFAALQLSQLKKDRAPHGIDLKKPSRERYYRCDLTTHGTLEPSPE